MDSLKGKKIAVLVDNGFELSEFKDPIEAMRAEGAKVDVISPKEGQVKSWRNGDWSESFDVDVSLNVANSEDYDGLILPGGVINPDQLRINDKAIEFVKGFFLEDKQKPVAAICHGPWTLINAGVVKGRKMTSYESIRLDLENAGAKWVNESVVVDKGLVTSRYPDDLPAFCKKVVEEIKEGTHQKPQRASFEKENKAQAKRK